MRTSCGARNPPALEKKLNVPTPMFLNDKCIQIKGMKKSLQPGMTPGSRS